MSIYLPQGLPANAALRSEGVSVVEGTPGGLSWTGLRIGIVNLMPLKQETELSLARLIAQAGHDAEVVLIAPATYVPRHVPQQHLSQFYRRWPEVRKESFDALIVTGAPVETLPFRDVTYWSEMQQIFQWARTNVGTTLYICWAAQAALHVFRGLSKEALAQKAFGVFEQNVTTPNSSLLRGMGSSFPVPVSRHAQVNEEALRASGLEVLARSDETGACIATDWDNHAVCLFDHLEYGSDTLEQEFHRDRAAGRPIGLPRNSEAGWCWQPYAALFFRNWLDLAARRRADAGAALSWFFRKEPAQPVSDRSARLVLQAESRPHLLADTFAWLAEHGFKPATARILRQGESLATVEIELQSPTEMLEGAAMSLISLPGVNRVVFRTPDGSGGQLRPRMRFAPLARAA